MSLAKVNKTLLKRNMVCVCMYLNVFLFRLLRYTDKWLCTDAEHALIRICFLVSRSQIIPSIWNLGSEIRDLVSGKSN